MKYLTKTSANFSANRGNGTTYLTVMSVYVSVRDVGVLCVFRKWRQWLRDSTPGWITDHF